MYARKVPADITAGTILFYEHPPFRRRFQLSNHGDVAAQELGDHQGDVGNEGDQ